MTASAATKTPKAAAGAPTATPPAPPALPDFEAERAEHFEDILTYHAPKGHSVVALVTTELQRHAEGLVALADVIRASRFHFDRSTDGGSGGAGLRDNTFDGLMAAQQLLSRGVMSLAEDLNEHLRKTGSSS